MLAQCIHVHKMNILLGFNAREVVRVQVVSAVVTDGAVDWRRWRVA